MPCFVPDYYRKQWKQHCTFLEANRPFVLNNLAWQVANNTFKRSLWWQWISSDLDFTVSCVYMCKLLNNNSISKLLHCNMIEWINEWNHWMQKKIWIWISLQYFPINSKTSKLIQFPLWSKETDWVNPNSTSFTCSCWCESLRAKFCIQKLIQKQVENNSTIAICEQLEQKKWAE